MARTATYTGPWPRKRHSHTCQTCKRERGQGAVACYKQHCARPQSTEQCSCCRPITPTQHLSTDDMIAIAVETAIHMDRKPTATYTPTAKFERELAEDHAQLAPATCQTPKAKTLESPDAQLSLFGGAA